MEGEIMIKIAIIEAIMYKYEFCWVGDYPDSTYVYNLFLEYYSGELGV
jgi:hypothetical protein